MKRLLAVTAILGTTVLHASAALAAPPAGDAVVGTGSAITNETFAVSAKSRADGTHAKGTLVIVITDPAAAGTVTAKVTCLSIVGNEAVIGGTVTSSTSAAFARRDGVEWFIRDDGNPDDLRIDPAETVDCVSTSTTSPIQFGSITIIDN